MKRSSRLKRLHNEEHGGQSLMISCTNLVLRNQFSCKTSLDEKINKKQMHFQQIIFGQCQTVNSSKSPCKCGRICNIDFTSDVNKINNTLAA